MVFLRFSMKQTAGDSNRLLPKNEISDAPEGVVIILFFLPVLFVHDNVTVLILINNKQ